MPPLPLRSSQFTSDLRSVDHAAILPQIRIRLQELAAPRYAARTALSPLDGGLLRARLAAREATLGTFVGIGSAVTAEVCAAAGIGAGRRAREFTKRRSEAPVTSLCELSAKRPLLRSLDRLTVSAVSFGTSPTPVFRVNVTFTRNARTGLWSAGDR